MLMSVLPIMEISQENFKQYELAVHEDTISSQKTSLQNLLELLYLHKPLHLIFLKLILQLGIHQVTKAPLQH